MSRGLNKANAIVALLLAATLAVACSQKELGVSQGREGAPVIVLSEGSCVGSCPVYDITLHADGRYTLNGMRYVKTQGVSDGDIGAATYEAAGKVLKEAGFWTMEPLQTKATLDNCQPDAPDVKITWRQEDGKEKTVIYNAGCGVQHMQELVGDLRQALKFDDLVWTNRKFEYVQPAPRL